MALPDGSALIGCACVSSAIDVHTLALKPAGEPWIGRRWQRAVIDLPPAAHAHRE
jgi:hypothetical protein